MTKIRLLNEDGVIKGVDTESGEEVPVEFDDLAASSVGTDNLSVGGGQDITNSDNLGGGGGPTVRVTNPSDESDINTAISGLPATGGTVEIVFDSSESGSQTCVLSNPITDQGIEDVTLRQYGDGKLTVADSTQISAINITDVDGWTIETLEIDGNIANQSDGGDKDNQVGILTAGCSDLTLRYNYVHDTQYANIRVRSEGTAYDNVDIYENRCVNTGNNSSGGSDNISVTALSSAKCTNFNIYYNECIDCGHQAIEVSVGCVNGTTAFNYIENSTNNALSIHFGSKQNVIGNIVYGGGSEGAAGLDMDVTNGYAAGNLVVDNPNGIRVQQECTVSNNVCVNCGIVLIDATDVLVSNNRITGSASPGISVRDGSVGVVANNYMHDTDGPGIITYAPEVVLRGNTIVDHSGFQGMRLKNAGNTLIANTVRNGNNSGIFCEANDQTLISNVTIGNSGAGINYGSNDDIRVWSHGASGNTDGPFKDPGARNAYNGTIELTSAPTDSNYDASDAGLTIIDTSGPTRYQVLQDGTTESV